MEIIRNIIGGYQTNCYIVFDETKEGVIIDPGGASEALLKTIEEKGINLKYIILTHGHGDHIGAVNDIKKALGVEVIAHEDEKEILENSSYNLSAMMGMGDYTVVADRFVKEDDIIEFGNNKMKVIHTPGHTKGGMSLFIRDHLFTGDTLFQGSIGRTDFYSGNMDEIIDSINLKLIPLGDKVVVLSGHGEVTDIYSEKISNPYIK